MAMLTVRNLPDEVHEILALAVKPASHGLMGDALAGLGHKIGLSNEDCEALENLRDMSPAEPLMFEFTPS